LHSTAPPLIANFGNRPSAKPPNFSRACNANTSCTKILSTYHSPGRFTLATNTFLRPWHLPPLAGALRDRLIDDRRRCPTLTFDGRTEIESTENLKPTTSFWPAQAEAAEKFVSVLGEMPAVITLLRSVRTYLCLTRYIPWMWQCAELLIWRYSENSAKLL
jgi:hypothetical protein